jgi:hypothetical protein
MDGRKKVLDHAKNLKTSTDDNASTLKKIYINKDVHPAWRKEHNRLRKVVKEEKEKTENAAVEILYDPKKRVVTRDGLIIDKFTPHF